MAALETIIATSALATQHQRIWRGTIADALIMAKSPATKNLVSKMVADGRISKTAEAHLIQVLKDQVGLLSVEDLRQLFDDPSLVVVDVDNFSLAAQLFTPHEIVIKALEAKNLSPHLYDQELIVADCFTFSKALNRKVCVVSVDEFYQIAFDSELPLEGRDVLIANAVAAQSNVIKAQENVARLITLRHQALSAATTQGVSMRQLGKELGLTHQGVSKMLK